MKKEWIKAALIRAVRTGAQTAVGIAGASVTLSEVDWKLVASASALAMILSVLMAIAGLPEAPQMVGKVNGDLDGDYKGDEKIQALTDEELEDLDKKLELEDEQKEEFLENEL